MSYRVQKALAHLGYGSRRAIEQAIREKKVKINGVLATLGCQVETNDRISYAGHQILWKPPETDRMPQVLLYHKPVGQICTHSDPDRRDTVFNYLPTPVSGRWCMVGRLDINSSGLIIFTNHGQWAHHLTHPKHHLQRIYRVRVLGACPPDVMQALARGVKLEDGIAKFDHIKRLVKRHDKANQWFEVGVSMGRNRIVRRLFEAFNLKVNRLLRIGFGPLQLGMIKPGQYYQLTDEEVKKLRHFIAIGK